MSKRVALAAIASAVSIAPGIKAQARYDVTDLGAFDAVSNGAANAINDRAQVVGFSGNRGFVWTDETGMTALPLPPGAFFASATAIDKHGDVALFTGNDDGTNSSFIFAKGVLSRLPGEEVIKGVNKRLHAVANAGFGASQTGLFWDGAAWTQVGTEARGLNDRDQVVGFRTVTSPSFSNQAFLWEAGVYTGLGTLGGRDSFATAISAHGVIVGASTVTGLADGHGFRWENGAMIDLGCLPGASFCEALALDDQGEVIVGTAQFPGDEDLGRRAFSRAFVWSDGSLQNLNTLIDPASGWTLETATGVNDSGQIVGRGLFAGRIRPYLLTPR